MTARHAKPPVARLAPILLLGSLWLGSSLGCGSPTGSSSDQAPADEKSATGSSATDGASDDTEPKLLGRVEIPLPEITKLDEAVQQQLRNKQSALAALCECPGVSDARLSQAYGEMGMLYHSYRLYDAAEACYRNAQTLAPGTFRWPYYLGDVYARQGDADSAIAAFQQALSIRADDVPALVGLAQAYLAANQPNEAEPFFERVLAKDAGCAAAHAGLGRMASLRSEHEVAKRHFTTALQLQPDATSLHYPLAMAYRNLKRPDKAAEHLKKRGDGAISFSGPLMDAVEALSIGRQRRTQVGLAAVRDGETTVALRELGKAVRADPDDSLLRLNLGTALDRSGDRDGAIRQYREAIRLRPNYARAHCNLAVVLAGKGAHDDALSHFREAVACDPQYVDAHLGLASLALKTGKHPLAVTHSALAVEIDPRHAAARWLHVVALTKAGRHAEAMDSLERSSKALPRNMPLAAAAARLWATCPDDRFRDGPKALKLAKSLLRASSSLEHAETLAMAFAETGNYDEARKWQRKAIEAAGRLDRDDAMPRLKKNLALYENDKPCRTPW